MQIIGIHFQDQGNTKMYIISAVRLRIGSEITTPSTNWLIDVPLNDNSQFTQLDLNSTCSTLKNNTHMACTHASKAMHLNSSIGSSRPISAFFHSDAFSYPRIPVQTLPSTSLDFLHNVQHLESSWMPQIIGLWLENIQYGTLQ